MNSRMMMSVWTLLLLSLLSLPIRVYVNVSSFCEHQVPRHPQHLQTADALVVFHPLVKEQWSLYLSNDSQLPQVLQIVEPGAAFIAVNFQSFHLLPGDKVIVRDLNNASFITITTTNVSVLMEKMTSDKSPHSLLLRTHPFLIPSDVVVIEYIPSIPTLLQPVIPRRRNEPVVVLASYSHVRYNLKSGQSIAGFDTESTVGATDEAKEAVCYRKKQPKMYAKARAVARLMIRNAPEQASKASKDVTNWVFCTGWLVGQGNYLMTNHHCMKDAAVVNESDQDHEERGTNRPEGGNRVRSDTDVSQDKISRVVEVVVSFMAETKRCEETEDVGRNIGVVEATRVSVVAENPQLDYALVRVLPNEAKLDLARRYGSLRLRARGPVDGEAIYIPQHPCGEPKEIAAVKDGKPAVIEVLPENVMDAHAFVRRERDDVEPFVLYNADTKPGSSGAPVLGRQDDSVVALHRAGTLEMSRLVANEDFNAGVRIDLIARDLQRRRVLPRKALAL